MVGFHSGDIGSHGGIDGDELIFDDDLSFFDFISRDGCGVFELEDISFCIGVVGGGGFGEFDLYVEFGVAFHVMGVYFCWFDKN